MKTDDLRPQGIPITDLRRTKGEPLPASPMLVEARRDRIHSTILEVVLMAVGAAPFVGLLVTYLI